LIQFYIHFSAQGKEYIHPGAIIVLSPEGKVTRYLYGSTYFLPFDLKMSVVEAAAGRSGPTINKVLKFPPAGCSIDQGGEYEQPHGIDKGVLGWAFWRANIEDEEDNDEVDNVVEHKTSEGSGGVILTPRSRRVG